MYKNKLTLAVSASLLMISNSYALEKLTEDDLASATGQDGISLNIIMPAAGWTAQEIVLTDKTGIPNSIKPGYDFYSGSILAKNVALNVCYEAAVNGLCTAIGMQGIRVDVDAVGNVNNAGPMLNIQSSLFGSASKLRVYIDKIAIRNGLGGNESTIIDFNHPDDNGKDYFDLLPSDGKLFNLQLGTESSGHMISFGSTSFNTIDFGEVRLTDKTDTGVSGNGRNLRFNLRLDNINLTDAGFDIITTGLVFSTPELKSMNVTFGNIRAGSSNTSMGTVGIQGLNLSKHALIISGKI
jgi:hypothetical protein